MPETGDAGSAYGLVQLRLLAGTAELLVFRVHTGEDKRELVDTDRPS